MTNPLNEREKAEMHWELGRAYQQAQHEARAAEIMGDTPEPPPPLDARIYDDNPDPLAAVRDGAWLDAQTFPPLRYAVPDIIPEGFTLLVGPPKVGKSWLILSVLLAVASGGVVLGRIPVTKGRVLYLALEDGHRRMQDRCRTLLARPYRPDDPIPVDFHYATAVNPGEVLATIEAFLQRHPDTVLVVIDTLGKVMPAPNPNETTYQRDYRIGGRIKRIADDRPGLAITALHHDRKAAAEDFVERVSGTNGLAGAADTVIVLSRPRQSDEGTLSVTGRDIPEGEYAITMAAGSWVLDGDNLGHAAQRARERSAVAGVGDVLAEIIRYVGEHPEGIGPSEVAEALDIDVKSVRAYLSRAVDAGRLNRPRRGIYLPRLPVASVATHRDESTDGNDATEATHPLGDPLWPDEDQP